MIDILIRILTLFKKKEETTTINHFNPPMSEEAIKEKFLQLYRISEAGNNKQPEQLLNEYRNFIETIYAEGVNDGVECERNYNELIDSIDE